LQAAPHGVALQVPLVASHVKPAPHDVFPQRGLQLLPTIAPPVHAPRRSTQISSGAQPASPEHWNASGGPPPVPPHGYDW
jgi:hypothetical protein